MYDNDVGVCMYRMLRLLRKGEGGGLKSLPMVWGWLCVYNKLEWVGECGRMVGIYG